MKSTAKSSSQIRALSDQLSARLKGSSSIDTVESAIDSNGWSYLLLSDGGVKTAGNPVIFIRIRGIDAGSKDIFGNSNTAFSPNELDFAYELDGTEGEPSRGDIVKSMLECSKLGYKIVLKEIADATAVSASSVDAASAVSENEYEMYSPAKGN